MKSGTIACSSPLCWRCHPNLEIAIFDKNFCVIIEIEPLHPDFRRNEGLCRYNTFFCHACGLLKLPDHLKEGVHCFDWFWWSVCIWTRAWGKSLKVQLASSNPKHFCFSVWNTISTEMTGSKPKPGDNPSHPLHISNWIRIIIIIGMTHFRSMSSMSAISGRWSLEKLRRHYYYAIRRK